MTALQEIVPKAELELQEVEANGQDGSGETTKELFRCEESPPSEELPAAPVGSPPASPKPKTPSKLTIRSSKVPKKEEALKKKSSSGIPLRMKSASMTGKSDKRSGSYRHPAAPVNLPVINRNTLEMQFINNKKRLVQLHSELVEKQRPLVEMHKSLLRTKKQLEEMGKKVVLEELKITTLKADDRSVEGSGESTAAEMVTSLKSSIEGVLDTCVKVCKKCIVKRDHLVGVLENVFRSEVDVDSLEVELEEVRREKGEMEKSVENALKENESKMNELLSNWHKTIKTKTLSEEVALRIADLEDTIAQQQKAINDAEDNVHSLTRKYEDKRVTYEKTIAELHEKINKLEDEIKKEKKSANENLMKSRNLRSKVTELEVKSKETEEKNLEIMKKLSQLQEQMRKKEIQWLKEKDDFKKNELLLQQKCSEKQSQLDTRLRDMEQIQREAEMQQYTTYKSFEEQLKVKDEELLQMEKEKDNLAVRTERMEKELVKMKEQLEEKDKEIDRLSVKAESAPALEYNQNDNNYWVEIMEYKQKMNEMQKNLEQQTEQINKMQGSLKAHAQLAAALKQEKDNAIKYSNKLRDILQEARDEIEFKNKTIYKIHEKLVLKEKACDKLKTELKEFEANTDHSSEKWSKNRCQICMSSVGGDKCSELSDAEVGKSLKNPPNYVSESLIGMSVQKVDHLRARIDNLKKMKLPPFAGRRPERSFSNETCQGGHLHKQIELRGKLYQILQKHADQSCEDFINLLKLTVSKGARDPQELKPSNRAEPGPQSPHEAAPDVQIAESFSRYVDSETLGRLYDKLNDALLDSDEMSY